MGEHIHRRTVRAGGVMIEYYDIPGDNGYLLILHGWMDSKEAWLRVARSLNLGCRVVIPDLPGFGDSDKPDVAYTLKFFVGTIDRFCRAIRFPLTGCWLMGHSFGGAIAVKLSQAETPGKLVLVDLPIAPVGTARAVTALGPLGRGLFNLGRRSKHIIRLVSRFAVLSPVFLSSLLIADVQKPTNRSATSTLETIASLNLRKDVCAITTDTLLVYGARDITVPVSQYKCLEHNANPHVRLYRISGSRHLPFIEKREEFSRVVRDFLVSRVPAGV